MDLVWLETARTGIPLEWQHELLLTEGYEGCSVCLHCFLLLGKGIVASTSPSRSAGCGNLHPHDGIRSTTMRRISAGRHALRCSATCKLHPAVEMMNM